MRIKCTHVYEVFSKLLAHREHSVCDMSCWDSLPLQAGDSQTLVEFWLIPGVCPETKCPGDTAQPAQAPKQHSLFTSL